LYKTSRILAYLVEQSFQLKQLNQIMNTKNHSLARRAITSARPITSNTPPAWEGRANFSALAFALAAALVPLAAWAGKPVKPPPPPSSAYVTVLLGGLQDSGGQIVCSPADINNVGQVVGRTAIPGFSSGYYSQAFLINPQDVNGDGKPEWFANADSDGQNDLIIPLGTLPACVGCGRHGFATAINDLGLVVGTSSAYDFTTKSGTQQAFIVVPENNSWFKDSNGDGFNDLMLPLGTPPGVADYFTPTGLDINNQGQVVGWFSDPNGVYQSVGFLLTPMPDAQGALKWFRDDGNGANALMLNLGVFLPNSINDSGQIVGTMNGRAMLLDPDGTQVDLCPAGTQFEVKVINNRGQIGLNFRLTAWRAGLLTPLDADNDGKPDTWSCDANGDGINDLVVDLGGVQGLENSYVVAHGLNDSGSVVGGSWHAGRDGLGWNRAPFLWQNGVLQTLKNLTGGKTEFWDVFGINNARQIICQATGREFATTGNACILLPTR
jgi:uncharacterized membrane protein